MADQPMARTKALSYHHRMGYLLVGLLGIVLLVVLVMALSRGKPPRGTVEHDKPVARTEPSAEEANPAASRTASSAQSEHARRHTPPA